MKANRSKGIIKNLECGNGNISKYGKKNLSINGEKNKRNSHQGKDKFRSNILICDGLQMFKNSLSFLQ